MKLSKKGMYYRIFARSASTALILAFIFPPAILLFLPILALVGAYEYLYWQNFEFEFEEGDLKITSGVITKNKLDIPVRRIQDIDVNKNIVHRIFEIAQVNVKTAGGSTSKASLKYLDEEEAEKIKRKLRELKNRREKQEESESQDIPVSGSQEEGETFYEISDSIWTYSFVTGASSVVFISLLLFMGAIGYSSYVATSTSQLVGYIIIGFVLALIGSTFVFITSSLSVFLDFYDFKVVKRGDIFEYEKGLLNKKGGSLPEEKIQKLEITENFLMRRLGYASLKAETAGYETGEEDTTTSTKTLIPLDSKEKVYEHARQIGELDINQMNNISNKAHKRYRHRYFALSTVGLAMAISLSLIGAHPVIIALPIAGFLVSGKASTLKWDNMGYSLGKENLLVMNGFWTRRTYIAPYFRFQNLITSETIFQRRWSLATITVDTAGDKVVNPRIIDLDRNHAHQLDNKLFDKFQNSIY